MSPFTVVYYFYVIISEGKESSQCTEGFGEASSFGERPKRSTTG